MATTKRQERNEWRKKSNRFEEIGEKRQKQRVTKMNATAWRNGKSNRNSNKTEIQKKSIEYISIGQTHNLTASTCAAAHLLAYKTH